MSTYTDLHNRIKENLTILRKPGSKDDGMSPQKVILVNPENQFYGTFNGAVNITSGILSGLKIIGSELEGVKLDDASVDGISLRELKTTVDVNTQDIEQLQKDAKAISAAHDALSVGLSSAVDNLSADVNEKLDNAVEEVKKSISGVIGGVTTLSGDFGALSGKVEALSSGMLNGVVYKGQLVLHCDKYDLPGRLFNDGPACCLLEGTQAKLLNGWMFKVRLDHSNVSGDYVEVYDPNTSTSCYIGEGDYLIIKNHLTSLYEVVPDNKMRLDDFDVINAQDEDDTKLAVLKQVSAYLDNKIDESLVSAKAYTDEVSAGLNILFDGKLSSVSAYALAESIKYTNGVSSEICSTVDSRMSSLSNDLSSYSNKLCSDLSTQVDAEFVHRAGDTIANLSIEGELSVAGKTTINHDFGESGGTKLEISRDNVELKTFAPLSISSTNDSTIAGHNIELNAHNLSIKLEDGDDDLFVNGESLKAKLDKKLGIDLARELSSKLALSSDISWDLNDYNNTPGYMVSNDVGLTYDPVAKRIYLITNGSHHVSAEIDTTDFVKDGMLKSAKFLPGGHDGSGVPEIELDFNTDAGIEPIYVQVGDLVDVYLASEDGITLSNNVFSLKYDDIKERAGINAISTSLYGSVDPYKQGWLDSLQEQINAISSDDFGVVAFTGHLVPDVGTSTYENLSGFFKSCGGFDDSVNPNHLKNGATYNIFFRDALSNNISAVTINTDAGVISVGNGDVFVVHDHSNSRFIHLSDLVYADDTHGNTYLLKAGVSRYEFEAEAKKHGDDDAVLSAAIDNKIFIDGVSAETLSAVHIGQEDYYNLVSSDSALSNVLYVVSSDYINAYGQRIENLAEPELSTDAATKGYVDSISSSLNSQIQQLGDDLSSEIRTLSTNLSTSISSLTSQMELALSALNKDPLSSLNADSKISAVIGAVLDIRDTLSALRSILRI